MTIDPPVFSRAPITEALLDIRVTPLKPVELPVLAGLRDIVGADYPQQHERFAVSGGVSFRGQPGQAPTINVMPAESKADGVIFKSADGRRVFQARLDGFTYHLLKPYSRWEDFSGEAKRLWALYQPKLGDARVTRLAVRYINRLELPLPFANFKDYVLTMPEIAPSLPQGLAHFFSQMVIPEENLKAYAIVTETMQPPEGAVLPFIFDIDAVKEIILDSRDPEIWRVFEDLRVFKNRMFRESLTDKAKELIA